MLEATNEQLLHEIIRVQRENTVIRLLLLDVLRRQGLTETELGQAYLQAIETTRQLFAKDEDRASLGFRPVPN